MEEVVVSLLPIVVSASSVEAQDYSNMFNRLEKAEEMITRTLSIHNAGFLSYIPHYRNLVWRANKILPIYRKRTKFQEIILAKFGDGNRIALFQDGEWQFLSGKDAERKFHEYEAKIPAMMIRARGLSSPNVLIIGGGDGLAARDVLEVLPNAKIVLVDIDKDMVEFARKHPIMRRLNKCSIDKIKVIPADGIKYLNMPQNREKFDLVIIDLPDPIRPTTMHLYGYPLIRGILNVLKPGGVVSIYSTGAGSKLQKYLWKSLLPYFREVQMVGTYVKEMGVAGFVWGIGKKKVIFKDKTKNRYVSSFKRCLTKNTL